MTQGGRANSTAAVTDNSTPWRVPKACTLLGRSDKMRMPRQVMVDAKKPISAHITYSGTASCSRALSANAPAVPKALIKVRVRQLRRSIQNGAPSVPTR